MTLPEASSNTQAGLSLRVSKLSCPPILICTVCPSLASAVKLIESISSPTFHLATSSASKRSDALETITCLKLNSYSHTRSAVDVLTRLSQSKPRAVKQHSSKFPPSIEEMLKHSMPALPFDPGRAHRTASVPSSRVPLGPPRVLFMPVDISFSTIVRCASASFVASNIPTWASLRYL